MIPVILSGGSGTRLWPVSRPNYPKQFAEFYDKSFLSHTIDRLSGFASPYIVTVKSMQAITEKTLREKSMDVKQVIYEPLGKNTAPAIALVCHKLIMEGKGEEVVGIFPADHLVSDEEGFRKAVELGEEVARSGSVVTLGIQPPYAEMGYGYIEIDGDHLLKTQNEMRVYKVKRFTEKPDLETARKFVESGQHFWNAGMFIFKVSVMADLFKKHLPEHWTKISEIKADFSNAKLQYANVESVSIDYGVMEKLDQLACIPCDIGWSDVGSWDELARLSEESTHLRTVNRSQVFLEDASKNYVFSIRDKVIGLIGVDHLIVVDTPDALLISRRGESQKVKDLLNQIKLAGLPSANEHVFEIRPWGGYEVLADDQDFKAKVIKVDPGAQLSYQSHEHRSEHWVVVKGEGQVVLNGDVHQLSVGDSISIPRGAKHRIRNPGNKELLFVEVQTGSYFGENDIVRYEDDYDRT